MRADFLQALVRERKRKKKYVRDTKRVSCDDELDSKQ